MVRKWLQAPIIHIMNNSLKDLIGVSPGINDIFQAGNVLVTVKFSMISLSLIAISIVNLHEMNIKMPKTAGNPPRSTSGTTGELGAP